MTTRGEGFGETAAELASAVTSQTVRRWSPGIRLSTRAHWLTTNGEQLLVVVPDHERVGHVDEVLGFLLGVMGNSTADLLLPQGKESTTLRRLPYISRPIRLWTYPPDGDPQELVIPTKVETLLTYSDPLVLGVHGLGDLATWVETLMIWADSTLVPAHRWSYLSWHCRGRRVLKIEAKRSTLRIIAGAAYKHAPSRGLPDPVMLEINGELSPAQIDLLKEAVDRAVGHRLTGLDDANKEHQFQAALAASRDQLGYIQMRRELPAQRVGRGFIDFFAVATPGQMIVVETKRGSDNQLTLQGLDYWLWATAHTEDLAAAFDADPARPVQIHYVVDSSVQPIVSPYTAAQAEAIDGSIPWRFRAISWEGTEVHSVEDLGRRQPPNPGAPDPFRAPRLRPPRYRWEIAEHLRVNAPGPVRGDFLANPLDGVVPAARRAWREIESRGLSHRFANHLRSSQIFGINLFAPLDHSDAATLLSRWFSDVSTAEPPEFEWSDPLDRLGETSGGLSQQTQVDVLLRATRSQGQKVAALVEVKFTEDDFGVCTAYQGAPESYRHVCKQPGPFGGDPNHCWSINNRGTGGRRTYDTLVGEQVSFDGSGCWYRTAGYQPMRNLALAKAMLQDGELDRAIFVVCAPSTRADLQLNLARISCSLPGISVGWLNAEEVLALHRHPDRAQLALRYDLRLEPAI